MKCLMQEVYYVHAALESDEGTRFLAAGGEPFCTSRRALRDPRPRALRGALLRHAASSRRSPRATATAWWSISRSAISSNRASGRVNCRPPPARLNAPPPREAAARRGARGCADPGPRQRRLMLTIDPGVRARVRDWVFDLDNTLYPARSVIYDVIGDRMTDYIARVTGLDAAEALKLRDHYFLEYGATIVGLARASWRRRARLSRLRARCRLFGHRRRSRARSADRARCRGGKSFSPMAAAGTPRARWRGSGSRIISTHLFDLEAANSRRSRNATRMSS